jgi:hypothetical protein
MMRMHGKIGPFFGAHKSKLAGLAVFAAIAVPASGMACGSDGPGATRDDPTATQEPRPTPDHTAYHGAGYGYGPWAKTVQGVVNRAQAIVIARVVSFDGSREEGPYINSELTAPPTPRPGEPSVALSSGYFRLEIERILLDDGFIADAPVYRGIPDPDDPRNPVIGRRYIMSLGRNSDNRSYGAAMPSSLIYFEDGEARYRFGERMYIEGPEDEESLIAAFEAAIAVRRPLLSVNEWWEPYAELPR